MYVYNFERCQGNQVILKNCIIFWWGSKSIIIIISRESYWWLFKKSRHSLAGTVFPTVITYYITLSLMDYSSTTRKIVYRDKRQLEGGSPKMRITFKYKKRRGKKENIFILTYKAYMKDDAFRHHSSRINKDQPSQMEDRYLFFSFSPIVPFFNPPRKDHWSK